MYIFVLLYSYLRIIKAKGTMYEYPYESCDCHAIATLSLAVPSTAAQPDDSAECVAASVPPVKDVRLLCVQLTIVDSFWSDSL